MVDKTGSIPDKFLSSNGKCLVWKKTLQASQIYFY